jgi:hypothetical protein
MRKIGIYSGLALWSGACANQSEWASQPAQQLHAQGGEVPKKEEWQLTLSPHGRRRPRMSHCGCQSVKIGGSTFGKGCDCYDGANRNNVADYRGQAAAMYE